MRGVPRRAIRLSGVRDMQRILKQAEVFAWAKTYRQASNSWCDFQQWCIDNHRSIDEHSLEQYAQESNVSLEDYVNISRFLQGDVFH